MKLVSKGTKVGWLLYENKGTFFLNVLCSLGPSDYSWTIELSSGEKSEYLIDKTLYLDKLARDIHLSAPKAVNSESAYTMRHISKHKEEEINQAFKKYRAKEKEKEEQALKRWREKHYKNT